MELAPCLLSIQWKLINVCRVSSIIFLTPLFLENPFIILALLHCQMVMFFYIVTSSKSRLFSSLIPQNIKAEMIGSFSSREMSKTLISLGTKIASVH